MEHCINNGTSRCQTRNATHLIVSAATQSGPLGCTFALDKLELFFVATKINDNLKISVTNQTDRCFTVTLYSDPHDLQSEQIHPSTELKRYGHMDLYLLDMDIISKEDVAVYVRFFLEDLIVVNDKSLIFLSDMLHKLKADRMYTDSSLTDRSGTVHRVHRAVINAACPLLLADLDIDNKELLSESIHNLKNTENNPEANLPEEILTDKDDESIHDKFNIKQLDEACMKTFIKYMYTGCLGEVQLEEWTDILNVAHRYDINELLKLAETQYARLLYVNHKQVIPALELAEKLNLNLLRDKALIAACSNIFIESEYFQSLSDTKILKLIFSKRNSQEYRSSVVIQFKTVLSTKCKNSPEFTMQNVTFYLKYKLSDSHMGLFLCIKPLSTYKEECTWTVSFTIKLISHQVNYSVNRSDTVSLKLKNVFDWGWPQFISLKDLKEKSFINENGEITIEVTVRYIKVHDH